jgi:CRP-like cAMP-binding protein
MEPTTKNVFKNRVLASLPHNELNRLKPHLTPVVLEQHTTLLDGDNSDAYFLEEGIASVVVSLSNGDTVEVGVIGKDGVVGIPILLGANGAPGRTFIQIAGNGYRIEGAILQREFERPGELRHYLQRYMHGFMVQTAQTAVCNRLHSIEERLSRWLLTCRDRTGSDELRLTHEFLGQMLGAPRSTVTLAAGILQRAGLIDYARGDVTIKNQAELAKVTCECYRTVRDEFLRLQLL